MSYDYTMKNRVDEFRDNISYEEKKLKSSDKSSDQRESQIALGTLKGYQKELETLRQQSEGKLRESPEGVTIKASINSELDRLTTLITTFSPFETVRSTPFEEAYQTLWGASLPKSTTSMNPVVMISKQEYMPFEDLKEILQEKDISDSIEKFLKVKDTNSWKSIAEHLQNNLINDKKWSPKMIKALCERLFEIICKEKKMEMGDLYNKADLKKFVAQAVVKLLEDNKPDEDFPQEKELENYKRYKAAMDDIYGHILRYIDGTLPNPINPKALEGLHNLINEKETQEDTSFLRNAIVRYDIDKIHAFIMDQIEMEPQFSKGRDDPATAKQLHEIENLVKSLRSVGSAREGNKLNIEQTKEYLKNVALALRVTYTSTIEEQKIYGKAKSEFDDLTFDSFLLDDSNAEISLPLLFHMISGIEPLEEKLKQLYKFNPKDHLLVAKGGTESFREAMMISLAEDLHLGEATVKKTVVIDLNFSIGGQKVGTGLVMPFIADINGHSSLQSYHEAESACSGRIIRDQKVYQGALAGTRLSPESYGLSLYHSLILHGTDDHPGQFTVVAAGKEGVEHLQNLDMGRNLPPGSVVVDGDGNYHTLLRTFLLDFPQLEDELSLEVIKTIQQNTPAHLNKVLGKRILSQFLNPFKVKAGIEKFLSGNNNTLLEKKDEILDLLLENGNYDAKVSIEKAYELVETTSNVVKKRYYISKLRTALRSISITAEKGTKYDSTDLVEGPEGIRINTREKIRAKKSTRDVNIKNYFQKLLKGKADPELIKEIIEGEIKQINNLGVNDAYDFSKETREQLMGKYNEDSGEFEGGLKIELEEIGSFREKIANEIVKTNEEIKKFKEAATHQINFIDKNGIDERKIKKMIDGQKKLLALIEQKRKRGEPVTGLDLANTLYPDEMVFFQARKKLGWGMPSLHSGLGRGNCQEVIDEASAQNFTQQEIDALKRALKNLKKDAISEREYSRYCT